MQNFGLFSKRQHPAATPEAGGHEFPSNGPEKSSSEIKATTQSEVKDLYNTVHRFNEARPSEAGNNAKNAIKYCLDAFKTPEYVQDVTHTGAPTKAPASPPRPGS